MIAYQVSGAHFNPAISLATFIAEWNPKNVIRLIVCVIAQYAGAFAGFLISYLLVKYWG